MTVIMRWSHAARPSRAHKADFPMPSLMRDIEEYRSPINGKPITSRSHRREDLKANGCVEWEPGIGTKHKREKGFKNARFARKHGLPLNERALDTLKKP